MSWPLVKLDDIATLLRGVTFSSDDSVGQSCENYLPVLRAGNIQEKLYTEEGLIWIPEDKIKENQKIKENDIVMCTSSGSADLVGKCAKALSNWNGSFGAFCAGIRANPKKVDASYLYHFLCSPMFRSWTKNSSGANIKNIRISELGEFKLPLPPLEEQKRIAAILDKADAIRRKRQHAIKLADDFLRSVFLEMFGDPVSNPKGFEIKCLSEFYIDPKVGTKCGPFGSALKKEEFKESGVPVWNMDNISLDGQFIDSPRLWVSEEKFSEIDTYSVIQGDVIISRAGTVGKMGVVRSKHYRSLISTNLIRVRFGELLLPEYFVSLMIYCRGRIGRLKTGPDGSFTHMNTGVLDTLEFPYPPIQLQNEFLSVVNKVGKIKSRLLESLSFIEKNAISVSDKAFSGDL